MRWQYQARAGISYSPQSNTYTESGNYFWTAPPGVTSISVEVWGGGGAGAAGLEAIGGGGGGGGGYSKKNTISVTPGNTYALYVGNGGTSLADGEDSYFIDTSTVLAKGGQSYAVSGSSGGQASSGVGDTKYSGGDGGHPGAGSGGNGGGSSAGTAANGDNGDVSSGSTGAAGGTAPSGGGNGGAGGDAGVVGVVGTGPGGGGGGGGDGAAGGNGADGKVLITILAAEFDPVYLPRTSAPDRLNRRRYPSLGAFESAEPVIAPLLPVVSYPDRLNRLRYPVWTEFSAGEPSIVDVQPRVTWADLVRRRNPQSQPLSLLIEVYPPLWYDVPVTQPTTRRRVVQPDQQTLLDPALFFDPAVLFHPPTYPPGRRPRPIQPEPPAQFLEPPLFFDPTVLFHPPTSQPTIQPRRLNPEGYRVIVRDPTEPTEDEPIISDVLDFSTGFSDALDFTTQLSDVIDFGYTISDSLDF